jgi:hypothetical protein
MNFGRVIFNYYYSVLFGHIIGINQRSTGGGFYKLTLDSYGELRPSADSATVRGIFSGSPCQMRSRTLPIAVTGR